MLANYKVFEHFHCSKVVGKDGKEVEMRGQFHVTCKYCAHGFQGGFTRCVAHLLCIVGQVKGCSRFPVEFAATLRHLYDEDTEQKSNKKQRMTVRVSQPVASCNHATNATSHVTFLPNPPTYSTPLCVCTSDPTSKTLVR
jgi:hypothetical protein